MKVFGREGWRFWRRRTQQGREFWKEKVLSVPGVPQVSRRFRSKAVRSTAWYLRLFMFCRSDLWHPGVSRSAIMLDTFLFNGRPGPVGGGSWLWLKGLARISCKMSLGVMDSNRMSGCNWLLHFCESLSITVSTGIQVTACKPATSKNHQIPMALGGEDIYTREI